MGLLKLATEEKIHTRNIALATYPAADNSVIVEGILKDERNVGIYFATGEKREPGIIHHLIIRLLIGPPSMTILDTEVEMAHVPRELCHETESTIQLLKGLEIKSGFSAKVRELMGGNKGCAHLTTLITSMSQEVIQGSYTYFARKKREKTGKKSKNYDRGVTSFLEDTCHVWRKDGPVIKKLHEKIAALEKE